MRFTDIDWLNREVAVSKAVSKFPAEDGVHKWVWKIGPPKSQKSNRRVALPHSVIELLSGLRQIAKDPEGLIFPGTDGQLMAPDYFNAEIFAPTAKHAGLEGVRFHDLRYFFASMLISQGESPKYVCDLIGHSSIQITFDTYGRLFPQAREEAAKKFQKAMFAGRKKPFGSNLVAKQARTASKEGGRARPNWRSMLLLPKGMIEEERLVAGDCNAPNLLRSPFRVELAALSNWHPPKGRKSSNTSLP